MLRTRMITRLAHRSLDWSGIQKKLSDPKARAALDSLRQAHSQIEQDAKKYMAPPAPINFAEYREKIKTKGLVDVFESDYNALQFEELNAADFMDEGAAETAAMITAAQEHSAVSQRRIEELKDMIQLMEETRTTKATTIEELEIMYPEILEEIDEEIANYEWEKDV